MPKKTSTQRADLPVKRPRGQPPKGDDARKVSLHVRVTVKELALWKKLAEENGQSLSDFAMAPLRKKHPAK